MSSSEERKCSKCQVVQAVDKFYGSHSWCATCQKDAKRSEYRANPDKFCARAKNYRNLHPEKIAEQRRNWWEGLTPVKRERQKQRQVEWKVTHPDQVREHSRKGCRLWLQRHPERHAYRSAVYRARKAAAVFGDQKRVKALYKWMRSTAIFVCYWCREEIPVGGPRCLDHYLPLVKGGAHSIDNLVPCCITCNSRKNNKLPEEFILTSGKVG